MEPALSHTYTLKCVFWIPDVPKNLGIILSTKGGKYYKSTFYKIFYLYSISPPINNKKRNLCLEIRSDPSKCRSQ